MPLTPTQIPDLVATTIAKLNKGKMATTQALPKYPGCETFFIPGVAREEVKGGITFEKRIRLRASTQTRMVQLYQSTPLNRQNYMAVSQFQWKNIEDKSVYYDRRETYFNAGEEKIIDEIDGMREAAIEGYWNKLEAQVFGTIDSSADVNNMLGLLFLCSLVSDGTNVTGDPVGGFNGQYSLRGDGTFTTTVAGIDASTVANTRWRNWCATHGGDFGAVTRELLRALLMQVQVRRIKQIQDKQGRQGSWNIFLPTAFAQQYEAEANLGPDDLGGDLAKFHTGATGDMNFRGVPLKDTPQVNASTLQPIIVVNSKHVYGVTQSDAWLKFGGQVQLPDAHNEFYHPLDGTGLLCCDNRREGLAIIHADI